MEIPKDLFFAESHEWGRIENNEVVVGISDYAQEELGDVVFVELPEKGESLDKSEQFAVIESVKAVSDIYMPLSGEIVETNKELLDRPELINESPYEEGWIVKIKPEDTGEKDDLMSGKDYEKYLEGLE
ncbi:MAG: glycine cleavage system protein GcvH [Halanaerobiales bacterium]